MSIVNNIKADLFSARKARDSVTVISLSTLLGEVVKVGKDSGNRETTDQEAIAVVKKFVEGLNDVISRTASSEALIERELIEKYIPSQLTRDEIYSILCSETGKSLGEMMKVLKERYAGRYDGKLASEIAKSIITST